MSKSVKQNENLRYSGNVQVDILQNNKVISTQIIHNSASQLFFKYILKAILGNDTKQFMPKWIGAFDSSGNASLVGLVLFNTVKDVHKDENNNYKCSFSFLISNTAIIRSIKYYRLYGESTIVTTRATDTSYLAEVELDTEILDLTKNIQVTWTMSLSNVN